MKESALRDELRKYSWQAPGETVQEAVQRRRSELANYAGDALQYTSQLPLRRLHWWNHLTQWFNGLRWHLACWIAPHGWED